MLPGIAWRETEGYLVEVVASERRNQITVWVPWECSHPVSDVLRPSGRCYPPERCWLKFVDCWFYWQPASTITSPDHIQITKHLLARSRYQSEVVLSIWMSCPSLKWFIVVLVRALGVSVVQPTGPDGAPRNIIRTAADQLFGYWTFSSLCRSSTNFQVYCTSQSLLVRGRRWEHRTAKTAVHSHVFEGAVGSKRFSGHPAASTHPPAEHSTHIPCPYSLLVHTCFYKSFAPTRSQHPCQKLSICLRAHPAARLHHCLHAIATL